MKREFIPGFVRDPKVEKESLEIEVTDRQVVFFMLKNLVDGRQIYNKIIIDKDEIKEFMEEVL